MINNLAAGWSNIMSKKSLEIELFSDSISHMDAAKISTINTSKLATGVVLANCRLDCDWDCAAAWIRMKSSSSMAPSWFLPLSVHISFHKTCCICTRWTYRAVMCLRLMCRECEASCPEQSRTFFRDQRVSEHLQPKALLHSVIHFSALCSV